MMENKPLYEISKKISNDSWDGNRKLLGGYKYINGYWDPISK